MKRDFPSGFLGACIAVELPGFFAFSSTISECLRKRKHTFPFLHLILQNKTKRICRSGYQGRCQLAHPGNISRQDKAGKCRLVWDVDHKDSHHSLEIINHYSFPNNLLHSTGNQGKAIPCHLSVQVKMLVWKAEAATTTAFYWMKRLQNPADLVREDSHTMDLVNKDS